MESQFIRRSASGVKDTWSGNVKGQVAAASPELSNPKHQWLVYAANKSGCLIHIPTLSMCCRGFGKRANCRTPSSTSLVF